jgi:hypothetical protein
MSDPITAAAIGAGISGGTSLLQGKKLGTSLKNAAIGGALGGAGGYLGGAMGGASNVGGAAKGGINFSSIGSGLGGTAGLPATGQGINLGSLGYDATQGANLLGNLGTGITQTVCALGGTTPFANTGTLTIYDCNTPCSTNPDCAPC